MPCSGFGSSYSEDSSSQNEKSFTSRCLFIGGGTFEAIRERVRETVTDRDARTMKYDEVPTAVQATIKANGDVADLKSIKQEVRDGSVNYDVEFDRDGKNTRLKIGQNGGLLEDNRK